MDFSDVMHDFAELASHERGDESVGDEGSSGGEDGGACPDAPAAGSDSNVPNMDDEEMNARVLRELELAR